ncbi:MAG: hypothetical protein GY765_41280 [bacterium]|nr:hypothetical protein [bacterium]
MKARFVSITEGKIQLSLEDKPKQHGGYFVFHSYTYIFRFESKLTASEEPNIFYCDVPMSIRTSDRRKYSRLIFESKENKIITLHNKNLSQSIKSVLNDISAGGFGFTAPLPEQLPKVGDVVVADFALKELKIHCLSKVMQVRGSFVGCAFLEKGSELQLGINKIVTREIQWRSEIMYRNLKKREEMMHKMRKQLHDNRTGAPELKKKEEIKLDPLVPMLDYFIETFASVAGTRLTKKEMGYRESTACDFSSAMFFKINYKQAVFKGFFYAPNTLIRKLAPAVFDRTDGVVFNSGDVLAALGKQLVATSQAMKSWDMRCTFSDSAVMEINKRLLSSMMKLPSVRMVFGSDIGDFNLFIMADHLPETIKSCLTALEVVTMDKLELMEPISYSTLNVFGNYLKLEIREKSVVTRDRLLPRFEISILLDIFLGKDIEGKVVLNLSKKLALRIYEILVDEKVDEFTAEVKDAVCEITNMITGNAKSEYEKNGIYYKMATPVVLNCKENTMVYAGKMPFLSSVYWTSEGFFDLSFSFIKKNKPVAD